MLLISKEMDANELWPSNSSARVSSTTQWGGDLNKSTHPLGGWEVHTLGMGSKLMSKMGYVAGQGLGRSSDGIRNPITAQVYTLYLI